MLRAETIEVYKKSSIPDRIEILSEEMVAELLRVRSEEDRKTYVRTVIAMLRETCYDR